MPSASQEIAPLPPGWGHAPGFCHLPAAHHTMAMLAKMLNCAPSPVLCLSASPFFLPLSIESSWCSHTSHVAPQVNSTLWEPPPAQPTAWPGWVSPRVRLAQGMICFRNVAQSCGTHPEFKKQINFLFCQIWLDLAVLTQEIHLKHLALRGVLS